MAVPMRPDAIVTMALPFASSQMAVMIRIHGSFGIEQSHDGLVQHLLDHISVHARILIKRIGISDQHDSGSVGLLPGGLLISSCTSLRGPGLQPGTP